MPTPAQTRYGKALQLARSTDPRNGTSDGRILALTAKDHTPLNVQIASHETDRRGRVTVYAVVVMVGGETLPERRLFAKAVLGPAGGTLAFDRKYAVNGHVPWSLDSKTGRVTFSWAG